MKAFSAREIKSLREITMTIANELVDALEGRRACDLAQAFAFPLPVRIICRMLDVSESDAPELGRLTSALVRVFDPQISQADLLKAAEAFAVLESYFSAVIVSRRDSTASDLVSLFLRSGSDGDRLDHDEIIANVILLFLAGHETTSNMLCNTISGPACSSAGTCEPEGESCADTRCHRGMSALRQFGPDALPHDSGRD